MKDSAIIKNENLAKQIEDNALDKATDSTKNVNVVTTKGGDVVQTNQNITHHSTSMNNTDPIYGKFLYGV